MIRGINDGDNLPAQDISFMFNSVQKEQLALHKQEAAKKAVQESVSLSQR